MYGSPRRVADTQDAMERPEGSSDMPPGFTPMPSSEQPKSETPSASSSKPAPATQTAPTPTPAPKQEEASVVEEQADEPMEVDSGADAKKEAEDAKAKGNAAYKARKFDEAIEYYSKAWELYPKDVTFLTNLSGEFTPRLISAKVSKLSKQLSTLNRASTRSASRHARRPWRRDGICVPTTRLSPSE